MSSSNLEPVPDKSVFIFYLIKNLKENTLRYLTCDQLFQQVRNPTINNTSGLTVPVCTPLLNVGDESGQFVFIRKDGQDVPVPVATQNTPSVNITGTTPNHNNPPVSTGAYTGTVNLNKVKDKFKAGDFLAAKAGIDDILSQTKNLYSSEAWHYKAKIYNGIAANSVWANDYPDARDQAFEALRRYVDLAQTNLSLLQLDGYKPVNEIYQGYFQNGANDYNVGKYESALKNFSGVLSASDYMREKGWITLKIDTTTTLYAGISAEKDGKKDIAAIYYGRLAERKITSINGSNMIDIYKWLVDFYEQKKDESNTNKYLALGKEIYPDDLYWPSTELDNVRASGNKQALWDKYDEIVSHFPNNHLFFFNYGLELYQYAHDTSSGRRPGNYEALTEKAATQLTRCLQIQPDYPQAALVLGQIYYNQGVDLQAQTKRIPGRSADDIKKRADLRIEAGKKFDRAIPYFLQVDQDLGAKGKLKMDEKSALKDAYDLLITIYDTKNDKDKSAIYTTKFNNVDKDH